MTTTKIQMDTLHVKLRGVNRQEAEQRAREIAGQVAEALGRETASLQKLGSGAIDALHISLPQGRATSTTIAEQLHRAVQKQTSAQREGR